MENPQFWWYLPGKMGIFMGYVSFSEGTTFLGSLVISHRDGLLISVSQNNKNHQRHWCNRKSSNSQYTLPETNSSPLKIGLPNRNLVFQPSIFMGYVSCWYRAVAPVYSQKTDAGVGGVGWWGGVGWGWWRSLHLHTCDMLRNCWGGGVGRVGDDDVLCTWQA